MRSTAGSKTAPEPSLSDKPDRGMDVAALATTGVGLKKGADLFF
jgi:hypothetical protein